MKLQLTYQFENEDELRAHLSAETRTTQAAPTAPAPAVTTPEAEATEASTGNEPTRDDLDGDGMPYDDAIHSDPPNFTADGLWRARRGKADEAKAARAAFKAGGGNVEPPAELPTAAPIGMPGGMPGMPTPAARTELPADAPAPVSLEMVIEKIKGMMGRSKLGEQTLAGLYQKHSGVSDPAASFGVFNTNESARSKLFAELCEIEPEVA